MRVLPLSDFIKSRDWHSISDDFTELNTGIWNTLDSDSGASVALDADGVGGLCLLTTGATNNNEAYLYSDERYKFADDKMLRYEVELSYTESATDDANVMVGVMDAVGANSLQDDGVGPKASYSGAVLFKVDGGTKWQFETSIGASQTTTQLGDSAGGAQRLSIEFRPITSTSAEVVPFIDGKQAVDGNGKPVKHVMTYTGATEMAAMVGVKAGSASSEVITVDYTDCSQMR